MGYPIEEWEIKRILQLRKNGIRWKSIAERLGRDINHIQRVAKQHGYQCRKVIHYVRCPDGSISEVNQPKAFAAKHGFNRGIFYGKQAASNGYSMARKTT